MRDGDTKDVWELSVKGTPVITYEATKTERIKDLAFQASMGPYFAGGGLVLFLLGAIRFARRSKAA